MLEVSVRREDHGEAVLVSGGDDLVVTHRPPRVDNGGHAGPGRGVEPVAEGKEGIAGARSAPGSAMRLARGDLHSVDAALLAGAYADGLARGHEHNGVRRHARTDAPGQLEIAPLVLRGHRPGDDAPD